MLRKKVKIEGNTDPNHSTSYLVALSERRENRVCQRGLHFRLGLEKCIIQIFNVIICPCDVYNNVTFQFEKK